MVKGGRRRRQEPEALTEEETAFLRSERTPGSIRQYVLRQHETVGVRTTAYRKVTAAATAERDALLAVATLAVVRAAAENSVTEQGRVSQLEADRRALTDELERVRQQMRAITAGPALAVHADGTGR
jgi:hypothetical protein